MDYDTSKFKELTNTSNMLGELFVRIANILNPNIAYYRDLDLRNSENSVSNVIIQNGLWITYYDESVVIKINNISIPTHGFETSKIRNFIFFDVMGLDEFVSTISVSAYIFDDKFADQNSFPTYKKYIASCSKIKEYLDMSNEELELLLRLK